MMKYYVFETKADADNAELYIRQVAHAPITGVNAQTGQLESDNQKTERWAIPQQRLDGKWVFQAIPDEMLAQYPQETIDNFINTFGFTLENFSSDWFETLRQ